MTETGWPHLRESDFIIRDFRFASGETLPELRQHCLTLGTPGADAVLLIHNTTGSAKTWLEPALAGELFGPGQPLDAARHFIIIPDIIGFGRSSKPSDGLRARFPHYRLHDVAVAQHRLITEGLNIPHLKLVMGLSLGGMLTWLFGEMFPDFMDALVPVASQPGPMSGRNWMQRKINVEAIRNDPEWNNGDYETQPTNWVRVAPLSALFTQNVVRIQERGATREQADAFYRQLVENAKKGDANNRLYQIESLMDYDPSADLETIKARLLAINFADDAINPPELGVLEAGVARIKNARSVVVPASARSQGHQNATNAAIWKGHLAQFLAAL
ncbi:MAG: alpha/beta fold hydrolase [Hyphomicrobiales bacterium]|nr:alpha/beta fold hydrolase [Alphaproteobacteria bacterium]